MGKIAIYQYIGAGQGTDPFTKQLGKSTTNKRDCRFHYSWCQNSMLDYQWFRWKLEFRDLHSMLKSHDIIDFLESMKATLFQQYLPGYQSYHFTWTRKHRCAKRDSGDMFVFVSDTLHKYVRSRWESDCLVWMQLQGKCVSLPYDINFGAVYIPSEGSLYANVDDFDNLCEAIRNYGSVLVSWRAKNRHILTAPEHLLPSKHIT